MGVGREVGPCGTGAGRLAWVAQSRRDARADTATVRADTAAVATTPPPCREQPFCVDLCAVWHSGFTLDPVPFKLAIRYEYNDTGLNAQETAVAAQLFRRCCGPQDACQEWKRASAYSGQVPAGWGRSCCCCCCCCCYCYCCCMCRCKAQRRQHSAASAGARADTPAAVPYAGKRQQLCHGSGPVLGGRVRRRPPRHAQRAGCAPECIPAVAASASVLPL